LFPITLTPDNSVRCPFPLAKLSDQQVAEIRARYAGGVSRAGPRVTHQQLADAYGVSPSDVTMIIGRKARAVVTPARPTQG
jgi:hypothetical protein